MLKELVELWLQKTFPYVGLCAELVPEGAHGGGSASSPLVLGCTSASASRSSLNSAPERLAFPIIKASKINV